MASAWSFNYDNIPPPCQQVATKLDILSTVNVAQCLTPEEISLIKHNLRLEILDLRQKIQAEQDYIKVVKEDLNVCKERITVIDKWEEDFARLDAVLPIVPKPVNQVQYAVAASNAAQGAPNSASNDTSSTVTGIPTFRCIDEAEWNTVPGYLKLRFKLDQLNSFVQALNNELIKKYMLLKKKKSTLKKDELSLRVSYEALETAETKNLKLFFVVASDMKKLCLPEKTVSSMRAILRHCHRLREIRHGCIWKRFLIKYKTKPYYARSIIYPALVIVPYMEEIHM